MTGQTDDEAREERRREIWRLISEGQVGIGMTIRDGTIYEASLVPYRPGDERYGVFPAHNTQDDD